MAINYRWLSVWSPLGSRFDLRPASKSSDHVTYHPPSKFLVDHYQTQRDPSTSILALLRPLSDVWIFSSLDFSKKILPTFLPADTVVPSKTSSVANLLCRSVNQRQLSASSPLKYLSRRLPPSPPLFSLPHCQTTIFRPACHLLTSSTLKSAAAYCESSVQVPGENDRLCFLNDVDLAICRETCCAFLTRSNACLVLSD